MYLSRSVFIILFGADRMELKHLLIIVYISIICVFSLIVQIYDRIIEQFGLEVILKILYFQPTALSRGATD